MEFTTGETTGPGAIAGVTEGPLPRPTSSHTPTPATPLPGIPDPVGVPKGTNNAYQNEYTKSFIYHFVSLIEKFIFIFLIFKYSKVHINLV